MKTIIKYAVAAMAFVALAFSASAQLGNPSTLFSTASGTVNDGVTNAKIAYNITATPNRPIDCTKGKDLFLQVRFQYTTTSIPATNTTFTFSTASEQNAIGATNRMTGPSWSWAVAGSTTDTGFVTATTNITVLGRPYVYLDTVLPLAPITNLTVKYLVK